MKALEGVFMSFIKKLNANQYLHIFEAYEKGYSFQYIINALNIDINPQTLSYKYRDYKAHGIDVLLPNTKRNCYSKKLKLNIINEYLHSDLSSYDLAIKYGIRSATQVKNWITMCTEDNVPASSYLFYFSLRWRLNPNAVKTAPTIIAIKGPRVFGVVSPVLGNSANCSSGNGGAVTLSTCTGACCVEALSIPCCIGPAV